MADAIIGATIQVLLGKVISLATDRMGFVFGFKKDLEALRESATMIQAVLADAETKRTESKIVQLWLKKVERVAFDAENVLDELNYEILRRQVRSSNQPNWKGKVGLFFSLYKPNNSFNWRMCSKVRDVNEKLRKFNLEAAEIGLVRMATSLLYATSSASTEIGMPISRQTNSLAPHFIAGRGKEESEIVKILLGSSDQNVYVLAIVGMGGIGKTTVAKSIYNNKQIDSHFSRKIWICVSERFEVTELFKGILESLRGEKIEMSGQDAIVQETRKLLHGQRFLLVLDDVWNENPKLWDDFFVSLVGLDAAFGSCCLLTTRLQTTANLGSKHGQYMLSKLSDYDCWSLLTQKATIGGERPKELNIFREQILARCQGLPLAASSIGGLLRLQKKTDWTSIVENKILKFSGDHEDIIMQILKLSFDHLPSPAIKKCFAYCSIFAKDTLLKGDQLIELWMAEGFLCANVDKGIMMEEIGGNYLSILLQSSLLEETNDEYCGQCYRMHDLVHGLSELVSKTNISKLENDVKESNNQVRYLALDSSGVGMEKVLDAASTLVQTLVAKGGISHEMLLKLKYLHVLELSGREIKDLSVFINKLKHLRYVDLSGSEIKMLPESLCELYNLQTLRLDLCYHLQGLPQGMSNLINLRHLHYFSHNMSFQMPLEMGKLTCLQTLEFFNIGKEKGRGIDELGCMEKLKGELRIRNLELVKSKEIAQLANLFRKKNLIKLEFHWGAMDCDSISNCDQHVLEGLQPHPNLRELVIRNFMGDQFPEWHGNLPMLVKLEFINCESCTELPTLGHLPYLETLAVSRLGNVGCIGCSFYSPEYCRVGEGMGKNSSCDGQSRSRRKLFPALKTLALDHMRNLTEWEEVETTDDVTMFPKLEHLRISDCCQLTTTPTYFPSLKILEIWGNVPSLVAKSIFSKMAGTSKTSPVHHLDGQTSVSDKVGQQHNINTHLGSLEHLETSNCNGLVSLPDETQERYTSFDGMVVTYCPNLTLPNRRRLGGR